MPNADRSRVSAQTEADRLVVEESELLQDEEVFVAGQWRLMWWRFRKHRMALVGAAVVVCFYLIAIFADFLAIADPRESYHQLAYMPP